VKRCSIDSRRHQDCLHAQPAVVNDPFTRRRPFVMHKILLIGGSSKPSKPCMSCHANGGLTGHKTACSTPGVWLPGCKTHEDAAPRARTNDGALAGLDAESCDDVIHALPLSFF
jgi:hypothetical protein